MSARGHNRTFSKVCVPSALPFCRSGRPVPKLTHEFSHVVLNFKARMHHRPIVSSARSASRYSKRLPPSTCRRICRARSDCYGSRKRLVPHGVAFGAPRVPLAGARHIYLMRRESTDAVRRNMGRRLPQNAAPYPIVSLPIACNRSISFLSHRRLADHSN
jgi:hypothetical protein